MSSNDTGNGTPFRRLSLFSPSIHPTTAALSANDGKAQQADLDSIPSSDSLRRSFAGSIKRPFTSVKQLDLTQFSNCDQDLHSNHVNKRQRSNNDSSIFSSSVNWTDALRRTAEPLSLQRPSSRLSISTASSTSTTPALYKNPKYLFSPKRLTTPDRLFDKTHDKSFSSSSSDIYGQSKSRFFDGQTLFGSPSARKNIRRLTTTPYALSNVRTIEAKPLARQPGSFSVFNNNDSQLSSVTQRVLESLEKAATPINDALRRYSNAYQPTVSQRPSVAVSKLFDSSIPSVQNNGRCNVDFSHKSLKYTLTPSVINENGTEVSTIGLDKELKKLSEIKHAEKALQIEKDSSEFNAYQARKDQTFGKVTKRDLDKGRKLTDNTAGSDSAHLNALATLKPLTVPISSLKPISFSEKETPQFGDKSTANDKPQKSDSLFHFSSPPSIGPHSTLKANSLNVKFSSPINVTSAIPAATTTPLEEEQFGDNITSSKDTNKVSISDKTTTKDVNSEIDGACLSKKADSSASPAETTISLFEKFKKKPSNTWSCPTCCVDNEAAVDQCVSCEEPNPNKKKFDSASGTSAASKQPEFKFGAPSGGFKFGTAFSAPKAPEPQTETSAPVFTTTSSTDTFPTPKFSIVTSTTSASLSTNFNLPINSSSSTLKPITDQEAPQVDESSTNAEQQQQSEPLFHFSSPPSIGPPSTLKADSLNINFSSPINAASVIPADFSKPTPQESGSWDDKFMPKGKDWELPSSKKTAPEVVINEVAGGSLSKKTESPPPPVPLTAAGALFNTFKKKASDTWACPTCCVDNETSDDKCVSCEEPNPNKKKSDSTSAPTIDKQPEFKFGAVSGFKFGSATTSAPTSEPGAFSFAPASTTPSTTVIFSSPASSAPSIAPTITTTSTATSSTAPASVPTNFNFGKPVAFPKIDIGSPAQINTKVNINFSQPSAAPSTTTSSSSLFAFGSQNPPASKSITPAFGVTPVQTEKPEVKFNFQTKSDSTTNQSTAPLFNSVPNFNFNANASSTQTTANSSSLFAFGAKPPAEPQKAAPFPFQAPAAATGQAGFNFSGAAQNPPSSVPSFGSTGTVFGTTQSQPQLPSFGSSSFPTAPQSSSAPSSTTANASLFSFGTQNPPVNNSITPAFGGPAASAEKPEVKFNFQSNSTSSTNQNQGNLFNSTFNFNANTNSTPANASNALFAFGTKPAESQSTPFAFQATAATPAAGFNFSSAPQNPPSMPSFGSSSSVFGTNQSQPQIPSFGSSFPSTAPQLNSTFKFNAEPNSFQPFAAPSADLAGANPFQYTADQGQNRQIKKAKRRLRQ